MLYSLLLSTMLVVSVASAPTSSPTNAEDSDHLTNNENSDHLTNAEDLLSYFNLYPNDMQDFGTKNNGFGGDRSDMFLYPPRAYYKYWIDQENNNDWYWDRKSEIRNKM